MDSMDAQFWPHNFQKIILTSLRKSSKLFFVFGGIWTVRIIPRFCRLLMHSLTSFLFPWRTSRMDPKDVGVPENLQMRRKPAFGCQTFANILVQNYDYHKATFLYNRSWDSLLHRPCGVGQYSLSQSEQFLVLAASTSWYFTLRIFEESSSTSREASQLFTSNGYDVGVENFWVLFAASVFPVCQCRTDAGEHWQSEVHAHGK